jgi:O-antigen/teichoic acid export membrane protein
MLALVACRLANTLSYLWLALPLLPGLARRLPRLAPALPLVRMGGWMSVSGVMTQALIYADRFLIGAMLSLAAVAYYATPLDLVLRAWIVPVAVAQTMLPAIAASFATDPREAAALLRRGGLLIMVLVLPACLLLVGGARELLWLWLGSEFAENGAGVLRILGVGVFFSCAAFAPGSLLDGIGRPDAAALLSLAEAAVFLPLCAALLLLAGIEGAAAAWALRAAVDCGAKLALAARLYPPAARDAERLAPPLAGAGAALLALLAATLVLPGVLAPVAVGCFALAAFAVLAFNALDAEERAMLRRPRALLRPRAAGNVP